MNDPHLSFAKIKHLAIRDKILADNPGIDDQTLADTVEGLSDLHEILAEILRDGLEAEVLATALEIRMEQMDERHARFVNRALRRRAVVRDVMLEAGLDKLTMPDFTASLRRAAPALGPLDENLIPADYWEQRPHLQRSKLLEALKGGAKVEGATLKNQDMTLAVRTR